MIFFPVCENLTLVRHPTPPILDVFKHRSSAQWPVGWAHVVVGDVDGFFITSGYQGRNTYLLSDIVWGYTPSSSSWKRILTTGAAPPKLRNACAVELAGRIFLHGGYLVHSGPGNVYNDDLFVYDIAENQWRKEGGGGIGRWGSICFGNKITNKLHVFGGERWFGAGGGWVSSNELRTYDNGAWVSQTDATGPTARYGMAATTVGEAVFLHGGYGTKCEGVS
jgi:hypothetical protein